MKGSSILASTFINILKNLWPLSNEDIRIDLNTIEYTESYGTYINDCKSNGQDKDESATPLTKFLSTYVTVTSLKDLRIKNFHRVVINHINKFYQKQTWYTLSKQLIYFVN